MAIQKILGLLALISFTNAQMTFMMSPLCNGTSSVISSAGSMTIIPDMGNHSAVIVSPNWLSSAGYPHNYHCSMKVTGPVGKGIQFDILDLATEQCCDYIEINEVILGTTVSHGRFRSRPTQPVRTIGNLASVTFKTDGSTSSIGFRIQPTVYEKPCDCPKSTIVPTLPSTTTSRTDESCPRVAPIHVQCHRGNLTKDTIDFQLSEALELVFEGDNTMNCRHVLYDLHTWALQEAGVVQRNKRSADIETVLVDCHRGALNVSTHDRGNSEATSLTFATSTSLQCHKTFVRFLEYVATYQPIFF